MSISECIDYVENINKTVTFTEEQKQDEDFFSSVGELLVTLKGIQDNVKKLKGIDNPLIGMMAGSILCMPDKQFEELKEKLRNEGVYNDN